MTNDVDCFDGIMTNDVGHTNSIVSTQEILLIVIVIILGSIQTRNTEIRMFAAKTKIVSIIINNFSLLWLRLC